MTDIWSSRIRADGVSRATVSPGAPRVVLSVSPTRLLISGFGPSNLVARSWHGGGPLPSQIATRLPSPGRAGDRGSLGRPQGLAAGDERPRGHDGFGGGGVGGSGPPPL